jgi:uncharacterized membrane protein
MGDKARRRVFEKKIQKRACGEKTRERKERCAVDGDVSRFSGKNVSGENGAESKVVSSETLVQWMTTGGTSSESTRAPVGESLPGEGPGAPSQPQRPSFLENFGKNVFMGILVFLPLVVLLFIVKFLLETTLQIGSALFGKTQSLEATVGILLGIVFFLAYAGHKFRSREKWLLTYMEKLILSVPFLGSWYGILKDLIASFSGASQDEKYLGVVKVPFGKAHVLGFVTRKGEGKDGDADLTVFVPTSPNPTSGLVFFFKERDVVYTNLSPEDAFARIISLGIKA